MAAEPDGWEFGGEPGRVAEFPRTLPHSEESERAVLGALLLDGKLCRVAARHLVADDFYLERHQVLFRACLELDGDGEVPDLRTLQAKLESRDQFDRIGGIAYLASLDLDLPDLGRFESYCAIVKDRATRRKLILDANRLIREVQEGDPLPEVIEGQGRALEVARRGLVGASKGTYESASVTIALGCQRLEDGPQGGIDDTLHTGLRRIDDAIVGMEPGSLWIISARPKVGKTPLALQILLHACGKLRRRGYVQNLEIARRQFAERLVCAYGEVDYGAIRRRSLTQNQWSKAVQAQRMISGLPFFADFSRGLRIGDVTAKARRVAQEHGLDFLILDYLNELVLPGERRNEQIGKACRELKTLAGELEIPVIALAQLKNGLNNSDRPPVPDDLAESDDIQRVMDGCLLVHRPREEDNPNRRKAAGQIIAAGTRDGDTCEVPIIFDGWKQTFREPE